MTTKWPQTTVTVATLSWGMLRLSMPKVQTTYKVTQSRGPLLAPGICDSWSRCLVLRVYVDRRRPGGDGSLGRVAVTVVETGCFGSAASFSMWVFGLAFVVTIEEQLL
ncbi:hypothetical protein TSMEX_008432 [Taenia solium]|eukprot:TsM_000224500 transcript=TsM_000224500 gene=TsM_000224500